MSLTAYNSVEEMRTTLGVDFSKWDWLSKAQYIEATKLLPGYILSSQGDRMAMANSVEGRFPFLDHRVVEFCCAIPPNLKMKVLKEKYILKRRSANTCRRILLKGQNSLIWRQIPRVSFGNGEIPEYVEDMLSSKSIKENGYFNPQSVDRLVAKCRKNLAMGFKDNMALVGILSMQIVDRLFIKGKDERLNELSKLNRLNKASYGLRAAV